MAHYLTSMETLNLLQQETKEDQKRNQRRQQAIALVSRTTGRPQHDFGARDWALVQAHEQRMEKADKPPAPRRATFSIDPSGRAV